MSIQLRIINYLLAQTICDHIIKLQPVVKVAISNLRGGVGGGGSEPIGRGGGPLGNPPGRPPVRRASSNKSKI